MRNLRVSSMLYAFEIIANRCQIRAFCVNDTSNATILKLHVTRADH
jgi:hypothetical protein